MEVYQRTGPDAKEIEEEAYVQRLMKEVKDSEKSVSKKLLTLESIVWVFLEILLLALMRPIPRVFTDERVPRLYLTISLVAIGILTSIVLYYSLFLNLIKRDAEYLDRSKFLFPVAAGCLVVGFFTSLKAIWPLYGFFTPVLLFVTFMSILHGSMFIPWKDTAKSVEHTE